MYTQSTAWIQSQPHNHVGIRIRSLSYHPLINILKRILLPENCDLLSTVQRFEMWSVRAWMSARRLPKNTVPFTALAAILSVAFNSNQSLSDAIPNVTNVSFLRIYYYRLYLIIGFDLFQPTMSINHPEHLSRSEILLLATEIVSASQETMKLNLFLLKICTHLFKVVEVILHSSSCR